MMVWKCPPLHLPNWSNNWKWKQEMKANKLLTADDMNLELCRELLDTIEQQQAEIDKLKATVRSFFEDFIDIREESDSGRVFAPITLSSTRCMMTDPLCDILQKMRKLSGAADAPKRESWDD